MSFEAALRQRLISDDAVKAASGKTKANTANVEWAVRPELSSYPAAVLTIVTDTRGRTMTGLQGSNPMRVQIDVLARTAPQKVALREAILAVLVRSAVVASIRFGRARDIIVSDASESDTTSFVHRDVIDLTIWQKQEA